MSTAAAENGPTSDPGPGPRESQPPEERTPGRSSRALRGVLSPVRKLLVLGARGVRALTVAAAGRPRRSLKHLLAVTFVLGTTAGVLGHLDAQRSSADAAAQEARTAAEQSVLTLLSYDHRTVAGEAARRLDLTTGRFRDEYGPLIKDVVVPAAQEQGTVTQTQVAASAPTAERSAARVSVLLFLNQTTTVAGRPDPTFSGSRVRVGMNLVDGRWLAADVTPV